MKDIAFWKEYWKENSIGKSIHNVDDAENSLKLMNSKSSKEILEKVQMMLTNIENLKAELDRTNKLLMSKESIWKSYA
jgi:cell shape-determining protein MreC